jgi:acetyl esterase
VENLLRDGQDPTDPDISPLYATLERMPPALFTCGTADLLIDDTLFMAARWVGAGNQADIDLYAGGCHVFQGFETAQAEASLARMEDFLAMQIERKR